MKTFRLLSIVLLGIIAVSLMAETQTGYVRTIGRNGKPGQPISGVMVRAEGPANMVMSDAQGQFTLTLHEATRDDAYRLASVKKNNYELLDKDIIGRDYGFTPVPMEIVLVNLTEMQAEKAAMAERFERQYAETYQKKMAELQAQYEAKQITGEEYATREEELTKALETMLAQIETLVDRYVRTDYDRLDSLDQVINAHIEMGEFDEAERLIRSKGSIQERLADLQEGKEAQRQIEEAQRKIEAANTKKQASLKRDLSLLIDIADAHLRPDSAYFYRKQLAEVDPEDVEMMKELMSLSVDFGEYESAYLFFTLAEKILRNIIVPDTAQLINIYDKWIELLSDRFDGRLILNENPLYVTDFAEKRLALAQIYYRSNNWEMADAYQDMAIAYLLKTKGWCYGCSELESPEAMLYFQKALSCYEQIIEEDSMNMKARSEVCGLKFLYLTDDGDAFSSCMTNNYNLAMLNPIENDSIIKNILDANSCWFSSEQLMRERMAYYPYHLYSDRDTFWFVCNFYSELRTMGHTPYADSCCNYAIELLEKFSSINYQDDKLWVLSNLYQFKGDYEKALSIFNERLNYYETVYGVHSTKVGMILYDIAELFIEKGDTTNAVEYYQKAITNPPASTLGENESIWFTFCYYQLGRIYSKCHKYEQALALLTELYEYLVEQNNEGEIAIVKYHLGTIYEDLGDIKKAKSYYKESLKYFKAHQMEWWVESVEEDLEYLKKKK